MNSNTLLLESGWKEDRADGEAIVNYYDVGNRGMSLDRQRQSLPIYQNRDEILYALEQNQVLLVEAETGSGKSTQIPQYLVEAGYTNAADSDYMIGVSQPRRVAATSLAKRVADEMHCKLGNKVGYSISFEDCWTRGETQIKFMTEGILIREMMRDPLLQSYSAIMIDEAHERTMQTDLLLGLLSKILRKRPLLKLIICSATLESSSMSNFFREHTSCCELQLQGKLHSLDIYYLQEPVADYLRGSVDAVIKLHESQRSGDVLVFLTGMEEVEQSVELLKTYSQQLNTRSEEQMDKLIGPRKLYALPLYASLPANEQMKVFETFPRSVRKVILATNLAETSLTIPGIRYVVDSGFVKQRFFDTRTSLDQLAIVPISQASARQRAGRAGRTMPGKVFRLYTKSEFSKLDPYTPVEIARSDLSPMLLQLKALGVDNVVQFPLPTKPPQEALVIALELLYALGCIKDSGALTSEIGLPMAEMPLHPMCARMLLASQQFKCAEEILSISAMLQIENVFQQPSSGSRSIQARNAKHKFSVEEGDLITYLNVYNAFIKAGKIRSWSDRNYLNYKGLLRAVEVRGRLKGLFKRLGMETTSAHGDLDKVRKCIVAGFFANAAYWHHSGNYQTIRGNHALAIHPSSVLYTLARPPKCVLFTQVLQTSRQFARDLTAIDSRWLHEIAPHFYEFGTQREINANKHSI